MSAAASSSPAVPANSASVLVIGGGISGLTLALFLHRLRIPCRVFEAYAALSETAGACLQLAPNGVNVIKALDLENELKVRGAVCHAYRFCNERGQTVAELPLKGAELYGADAITCSRHRLHTLLARTLEEEGLTVEYGHKLAQLQQDEQGVTLTFENGRTATGAMAIGCDGLHSRTRELVFPLAPQPAFIGYLGSGGVVPFSALTEKQLALARMNDGVMTVTRGPVGAFGTAETGRSAQGERQVFVWTNTPLSLEQCNKARTEMTSEQVHDLLAPNYSSWYDPLPTLLRASTNAELGSSLSRGPIFGFDRDLPSWNSQRVLLIGDAAHATGPGGQGASTALEDAHFLARLLQDAYADSKGSAPSSAVVSSVFGAFELHRRPRVLRINAEARSRGDGKLRTYGPVSGWLRDRMMGGMTWWFGDAFFRDNFSYRIPGYDTMLCKASVQATEQAKAAQ